MRCRVYLTSKEGLLIPEDKDLSDLPDSIKQRFEKPILTKTINVQTVDEGITLDTKEVFKNIQEQGYHIGEYRVILKII